MRVKGVQNNVDILLHDVDIVIVVFVFLLILVLKNYVLLRLLDVWLEHFVRGVSKFAPFVYFILEVMISNVWISIRHTDIVPFSL